MNLAEIKAEIVKSCHRMWQRGHVANHDGNITFKISPNLYLATPTSFSKADITEDDLLIVNHDGVVQEGKHKLFSEFSWHMHIYQAREDIQCVVHGHPVVATGMGLNSYQIGTPGIPEAIVSLGKTIQTLKLYSPLEIKLKEKNMSFLADIKKALYQSDAFLCAGNGVWTVGQSVLQTYLRLELVEQLAQATMHAKNLGGVKPLPRELVEELFKKRPQPQIRQVTLETPVHKPNQDVYSAVRSIVETEVAKIIEKIN